MKGGCWLPLKPWRHPPIIEGADEDWNFAGCVVSSAEWFPGRPFSMASQYKHHDPAGKAARQRGNTGAKLDDLGSPGLIKRVGTWASFVVDSPMQFTRPDLSGVRRLVFVCSANLVRSAFAQALCARAGIEADSFGLHAHTGTRTFATPARIAAAMGATIDQHRARHWRDFTPEEGDVYLAMRPEHARQLWMLGFPPQRIALLGHWSQPRRLQIRDPHGRSEVDLRRCFALIQSAVNGLVDELRGTGAGPHRPGQEMQPRPLGPEAPNAPNAPNAPRPPLKWLLGGVAAASLVDL